MKIRNLLIAFGVAAMATVNVMATDALLSPRGLDHQPKMISGVNNDPNLVAPSMASAAPRVLDNQIKTVSGKSTIETPTAKCTRYMSGTPKMIGQCAEHPGAAMPCCSVAGMK